jgi:arsenate reductase
MPRPITVLFVCLHGSAKSLVAARYCEQLAEARGIGLSCGSAGLEPDSAVPPHVIAGLAADGIDVSTARPAQATAEMVTDADYAVALGCDLSAIGVGRDVSRWDDIPAVSDGYDVARDAIVVRLHQLLDEISATAATHREA